MKSFYNFFFSEGDINVCTKKFGTGKWSRYMEDNLLEFVNDEELHEGDPLV